MRGLRACHFSQCLRASLDGTFKQYIHTTLFEKIRDGGFRAEICIRIWDHQMSHEEATVFCEPSRLAFLLKCLCPQQTRDIREHAAAIAFTIHFATAMSHNT